MAGLTVVGGLSLAGVAASADSATPAGAYLAFFSAIGLWAWHEASFLFGFLTGPRRAPCPPDAVGWTRFRLAAATLIHHEAAIALTLAAVAVIAWGGQNQVAVWTFGALFALRLSSKLNLFFGVPNFNAEMLPDHLAYLKSYFRTRAPTAFYWVSVAAGVAAALGVGLYAARDPATGFEAVGATLVFTLIALGLLEHALMAAPITDSVLWRWAMANARPKPLPVTTHGR
jgi:putative photosynthetic complex assembly protein 2